jgi:undecaprenyl phosphate N,N'-diacetylbacillosamine 1-phosphate transferase
MTYGSDGKRIIDFILSLIIVLVVLPFLLIAAFGIKISSKGPIIFIQKRIGLNGCVFEIYKLRTMHMDINREISQTYNSDPSVFVFGKILRRLKIDELPQVFNVLRGDMSWIGPRPCLEKTFSEMPEWAKKRAMVRPGITGMAQVNGNVALTWDERWQHDVRYVNELSLWTDIKIIIKSIGVVVFGEEKFMVKP